MVCEDPDSQFTDGCTCPGGYKEGELLPHNTNQQLFFICSNKTLHEGNCGIGNVFNVTQQACVPATDSCNTEEMFLCAGAFKAGEFVPNRSNPQLFYICSQGILQPQDCGQGNIFDVIAGKCVQQQLRKSARSALMNLADEHEHHEHHGHHDHAQHQQPQKQQEQQEVRTLKKFTHFFQKLSQSIF